MVDAYWKILEVNVLKGYSPEILNVWYIDKGCNTF